MAYLVHHTPFGLFHHWTTFRVFLTQPRREFLTNPRDPFLGFTCPSESASGAAVEFIDNESSNHSTASPGLSVPSALQMCQIHSSQAYHTYYVALSGFRTLLELFSSAHRGALFHALNALGILPFRVFPCRQAGTLSVSEPS